MCVWVVLTAFDFQAVFVGGYKGSITVRAPKTLLVKPSSFLFIEMINKAGNLRGGMAGIEPTLSIIILVY